MFVIPLTAETLNFQPSTLNRRPREEYISTILKPQSWGGAIELAVFAKQ